MKILGVETSCDDTSAAVVTDGRTVHSCIVSSQNEFHRRFGGVVPEVASRAHMEVIDAVCADALERAGVSVDGIDAVAVTNGPGLVGSILVGLGFAKGFAYARDLPFLGVNHLEGHIAAAFLDAEEPHFPFTALVVSGGHTHLYEVQDFFTMKLLGQTVDDAAGEAFDKVAKLLGLDFPGGIAIDRLAREGDERAFDLPRPMLHSGDLMMSFSGLKTAVRRLVEQAGGPDKLPLADVAASFQAAVVDTLVAKSAAAMERAEHRRLVICGGVSANSRLRAAAAEACEARGLSLVMPSLAYCTDNAAMIAGAGYHRLVAGQRSGLDLNSYATLSGAPA
ncbi:MAG: tRNA (adenosine(37)-N6)-threonylcarbamoyltransferase complex transferase subunit TsaD [Candidatus Lernaella stagnicola]|nr:tRNA (adenosine(37)-N6)-threonylcarbamoyltransferase complex transferase subunit TsaD [Candidatus Lernaella stagnicola]